MKAALYLRVSTEEQAENYSIPSQKERLEAFCRSQDWEIYDYYIDDGFSGKSLDRPAITRLLQDARAQKFDIALVYRLDRFSRRAVDLLRIVEEVFEPHRVFLKSATEPFDTSTTAGRMMLTMLVAFAQFERESIAERVKLNMAHKASQGEWCGANQPPLGYKNVDKKLIIVEDEAAIVRRIFEMYLAGHGFRSIAMELNARGLLPRSGKKWLHTTVRNILVNPIYAGNMVWNRTERKGTRTIIRPKDEWIIVPGEHEAIVTQEVFDRAQTILGRKGGNTPGRPSDHYALSGLIYCGLCGSKYRGWYKTAKSGRIVRYYRCGGYIDGVSCKSISIQVNHLEEKVVTELEKLEFDRELLQNIFQQHYQNRLDKHEPLEKELREVKRSLAGIGARKQKWFDAYEAGILGAEDLKERIAQINKEKSALERRLEEIESELANLEMVEFNFVQARQNIKNIRRRWYDAEPEERKQIARSVINRIVIYDRDNIDIELFRP